MWLVLVSTVGSLSKRRYRAVQPARGGLTYRPCGAGSASDWCLIALICLWLCGSQMVGCASVLNTLSISVAAPA